jgi:acyl-CoA thioesterase YciA
MTDQLSNVPGGPHLRTVAMPRDTNPSGDIFGGWTVSQMDLAGGSHLPDHQGLCGGPGRPDNSPPRYHI